MGCITGVGGVFLKAKDPSALANWYQQHLGISFNGNMYKDFPFTGDDGKVLPGYTVLSFFKEDTDYFDPSAKQAMINLRVEGLFELLEKLKANGVALVGEPMDEVYGKFAWIVDPEGNKIELWEPPQQ